MFAMHFPARKEADDVLDASIRPVILSRWSLSHVLRERVLKWAWPSTFWGCDALYKWCGWRYTLKRALLAGFAKMGFSQNSRVCGA